MTCFAQVPEFDWVNTTSAEEHPAGVSVRDVTTDGDGNIYSVGKFSGVGDFDPEIGGFILTSAGNADLFIQKVDPDGNLLWAHNIGGPYLEDLPRVEVDQEGNVYFIGDFRETFDFDPGPGVFNMESHGSIDIFIQKLDSDGNFIWAKQIGGIEQDYVGDLRFDNTGNLYITGGFRVEVDFNPGPGEHFISSNGWYDVFLLKLTVDGNFVWAHGMGGVEPDFGTSLTIDTDGNPIIGGFFLGEIDLDPGPEVSSFTPVGYSDAFVEKFSPEGIMHWVKRIGGFHEDRVFGVTSDLDGNIYSTGFFNVEVDFDPGPEYYYLESVGLADCFIQKLDADGEFVWAERYGSNGSDYAETISIDTSENIYSAGYFNSGDDLFDIDPTIDTLYVTGGIGNTSFIQKLDKDGGFVWGSSIDGWNNISSLCIDNEQSIILAGTVSGITDFDIGEGVEEREVLDSRDGFLLKLKQCQNMVQQYAEACNSYFWEVNGEDYTESGDYSATLINAEGCDSIIWLHLEITANVMVSVSESITLVADLDGADYQWLDCDNDYAEIPGEIEQEFTPLENGNYAVVVDIDGCTDTSECHSIVSVGINNNQPKDALVILSDPINGLVYINFDSQKAAVTINAHTIMGELIKSEYYQFCKKITFPLNVTTGYYLISVSTIDGISKTVKVFIR
ncbi:MAG: hypothetical protein GQ574_13075 [Crocinitomix sp.]|nr:hypothetical protein [Crocinitomix sp.]